VAPSDVRVAGLWIASRLSVFVAAAYASWVLAGSGDVFVGNAQTQSPDRSMIDIWDRWDVSQFHSIATTGYGASGFETNFAFPPGLPLALKAVASTGLGLTAAGLVISAFAGLVAALALGRLTSQVGGAPEWGVAAWMLAPVAVFLAAPYSEALFCAFAFWGWVLARRGAWLAASLLVAAAALVRVNGVFLAIALVVCFVTSPHRRMRQAPFLALPFVAVFGVVAYYRSMTGTWSTWPDVESSGWGRHFTSPWRSLSDTIDMAFHNYVAASFGIQYRMELVFMGGLVVIGIVLLFRKWWGEAVYVLLTCGALGTSTLYYSVPRSAVVLFPVWMLLGAWMTRGHLLGWGYAAIAAPLMLVSVVGFVTGHWIA
jgi:Mannosyltransferase (PIG-V)